jgi:hypothetical protein
MRATPPASAKRKAPPAAETSTPNVRAFIASIPPTTRVVTMAALAFITIVATTWKGKPVEAPAREVLQVRREQTPESPTTSLPALPEPTQLAQVAQVARVSSPPPPATNRPAEAGGLSPQEALEVRQNEESQRQLDANADGSSEMTPIADAGPSPPSAPSAVPLDEL